MRWPKGVPEHVLREDDVYIRIADRYYQRALENGHGATAHLTLPPIGMKHMVMTYIRIFQVEDRYAGIAALDGLPSAAAQAVFNAAKLATGFLVAPSFCGGKLEPDEFEWPPNPKKKWKKGKKNRSFSEAVLVLEDAAANDESAVPTETSPEAEEPSPSVEEPFASVAEAQFDRAFSAEADFIPDAWHAGSQARDSRKQDRPIHDASFVDLSVADAQGYSSTVEGTTGSDKQAPFSVSDNDGHPLRSVLACRYLEILSRDRRNDDDDLVEYCRQFELCSDIVSKDHLVWDLASLFLLGLPSAMVYKIRLSHAMAQGSDIAIDLVSALRAVRDILGRPDGTVRLLTTVQATPIDRLLASSFAIKGHPKADLAANAKFESFYKMITSLDEDQLVEAVYGKESQPVPAASVTTSSADSDRDQVQYTPSASSSMTMEHGPVPEIHIDGSLTEAQALVAKTRDMLISLVATETALRLSQGIDAPCLLTEDMQDYCKALIKQLK